MHFDPRNLVPREGRERTLGTSFRPSLFPVRSATSAGISFQYSGSTADHVQEQLKGTFKQNTSNVVSCVLRSFCALLKKG